MNDSPPPASRPSRGLPLAVKLVVALTTLIAGGMVTAGALLAVMPGVLLPLVTQRLPGLEVGLPPGHLERANAGDYRSGKISVKAAVLRPIEIAVEWQPGTAFSSEDVDRVVAALSLALPGGARDLQREVAVAAPGAASPRSFRMVIDGASALWETYVVCGGRQVSVVSAGPKRDTERMHRRVVGSLRCQADPVKEASLGDVPVVMGVPAGWHRLKGDPEQVKISDGRYMLIAGSNPGRLDEQAFGKLLPGLFGSQVRFGARTGSNWAFAGTDRTNPFAGWMTLKYCEGLDQTLTVFSIYEGDQREGDHARSLLEGVRCRRRGEPAEVWPAAAAAP
jgi:hypothetical protein